VLAAAACDLDESDSRLAVTVGAERQDQLPLYVE
jgi:hypothetical protein